MNVLYFLKKRTEFIRHFYESASEPFHETIRKIDLCERPFDNPGFSEDSEPPFMEEWSEAGMALNVLGRTCVSLLSASLKLYFNALASDLGINLQVGGRDNEDWFARSRRLLGVALKLPWEECPIRFDVLEQVNLARNRDQHPDRLTSLDVQHDPKTREKYAVPFFVSETEKKMFDDPDIASISFMSPTVHITREALILAIDQVEALGDWIEERRHPAPPTNIISFKA